VLKGNRDSTEPRFRFHGGQGRSLPHSVRDVKHSLRKTETEKEFKGMAKPFINRRRGAFSLFPAVHCKSPERFVHSVTAARGCKARRGKMRGYYAFG